MRNTLDHGSCLCDVFQPNIVQPGQRISCWKKDKNNYNVLGDVTVTLETLNGSFFSVGNVGHLKKVTKVENLFEFSSIVLSYKYNKSNTKGTLFGHSKGSDWNNNKKHQYNLDKKINCFILYNFYIYLTVFIPTPKGTHPPIWEQLIYRNSVK